MVKKFKSFVEEKDIEDFEEDVLGETQSKKQIDLVDKKKKEVEEKNENM